jgi:hypothetical protein
MKNKPLFHIYFEDQSLFTEGTDKKLKWKDIPTKKKIKSLFYLLPTGDYICIEGYLQYLYYSDMEYAYLIGKLNKTFRCYKISRTKIIITEYAPESNFVKKLNKELWKIGII